MTNIKMVNEKNKLESMIVNFLNHLCFIWTYAHIQNFCEKKKFTIILIFWWKFWNAGDFEFLLRVILKSKINYKMNDYLVSMSYGGKATKI